MNNLKINISGKEIQANRPEPIISDLDVVPFNKRMDINYAVESLLEGYYVLVMDFYSVGLEILNELKNFLNKKHTNKTFKSQREFRSKFHNLSNKILLEVNNNKLAVKKAPEIGWIEILYPGLDNFLLPFPQIQGLNSSWQWYKKGLFVPVLNKKIHPWFGTYFPTRFEHLELFDNWLKNYKGKKKSAFDIGIGSGILSFQMLNNGFEKIYATDINPNAIIGLDYEIKNNNSYQNINLFYGNLFADCNIKTDLIVFNPPWIPASHNTAGIDKAIYYDENLFKDFFTQAKQHLNPKGKIVIIFSNLAEITNVTEKHPIKTELSEGGRFKKELFIQKNVGKASKKTKRNQNWRKPEMVELWVLAQIKL